jgi:alcohol dehydrogenase class IV
MLALSHPEGDILTEPSTPRLWDNPQLDGVAELFAARGWRRAVFVLGSNSSFALNLEGVILQRFKGIDYTIVSRIPAGSPVSAVLRVRRTILDFTPNVVVAMGGGSVIDTAKAASGLAFRSDPLIEDDVKRIWATWPAAIGTRAFPLVAIPTTAGTGTEATPYAVLSDAENNKLFGVSPFFQPDYAVMVPEFVRTVPPPVIAELAMDAMSHALEAYWSKRANAVSDLAASTAILLLDSHLLQYYRNPADTTASRAVLLAATHAGEAFRIASSTACHALSFPIATVLHASHGHACSLLLALIAEKNLLDPPTRSKLDGLARSVSLCSAAELPEYVRAWRVKLGLDQRVAGPRKRFAEVSSRALPQMMANNPVSIGKEEIDRLLDDLVAA